MLNILMHPFGDNFKALRENYNISMREMAQFLFLKNMSSIAAFESGRNFPSNEVLISIADCFGISIDWLEGRSLTPYTEESVFAAETKLFELFQKYGVERINIFLFSKKEHIDIMNPPIPNELYDNDNKKELLVYRANHIFLLNATLAYYYKLEERESSLNPIARKIKSFIKADDRLDYKGQSENKLEQRLSELFSLWNVGRLKGTKPSYDLNKWIETNFLTLGVV